MSVKGTLVEVKMCVFTLESTHFIFNKCPIYIHDGASAKFSLNSQETDYSVLEKGDPVRYRNKGAQSGTGIRGPSPVPE